MAGQQFAGNACAVVAEAILQMRARAGADCDLPGALVCLFTEATELCASCVMAGWLTG